MDGELHRRQFLKAAPAAVGGVAGAAGQAAQGATARSERTTDVIREPVRETPARIGVRETRHVRCRHQLTAEELLAGKRFPDAIANGTYHIDAHSASGAGVKFRELRKGVPFYQVPFASLVPRGARNVLIAGRCIDADEQAFGAVRVMVNCNQMGQAAGVGAWLALDSGAVVGELDAARLRTALEKQGAVVI
jgi:hypothetical protein